jgi:hypothetical protein
MIRRFAYGENIVEGVSCPSGAAGLKVTSDGRGGFISEYDEFLSNRTGKGEGVVDERKAKEAWEIAYMRGSDILELRRDELKKCTDEDRIGLLEDIEIYSTAIKAHQLVADKLGWGEMCS